MPDLSELECLIPPEDFPGDAIVEITVDDLRALTALIPAARELQRVFGDKWQPQSEAAE